MKPNLLILSLVVVAAVAMPGGGRADGGSPGAGCRHADLVFYSTDSNRLAQRLHANQSVCADFYISTTPAGDLVSPRSNIAPLIRANGPQFHAMPEFRPDEWAKWLAAPANAGKTWFDAGVEFRRRMVTAGFDVAKGDTWVINDVGWPTRAATGVAVFEGTGTARADLLELVRGLYTGDPGMPTAPGAVFGAGPVQATTDLAQYRHGLQAWYADSAFWLGLTGYVRFWAQDTWADARDWGVPGSTLAQRSAYLDDYFVHPTRAALAGGETMQAAAAFLAGAYTPLGNAAFRWGDPSPPGPGFGSTDIGLTGMQSFVSSQTEALRSASAERFGFGVVPNGASAAETIAVEDQVANSIHASEADASGACDSSPGCGADVDGAQFADAWTTFANTLEGAPVQVEIPPSVTVTFASVDARGATGVAVAPLSGPVPQHAQIRPGALSYALETSAGYYGPVDVCAPYDAASYDGYVPRLFELVGADWSDVTTTAGASRVCGTAPSLGTFAIFAVDPTPPVIVPHVAGRQGNDGWYVGDVGLSWDVGDAQSPISATSGCEPSTITADTAGASVTCKATSDGGTASVTVTVARDATPPALTVPTGVVVDATDAMGGVAVFASRAVDAVDPAPTVVCAPVSGTRFAIGDTTVTCTAADAAGNSTTTSFVVHVRGAAEQLAMLAEAVDGFGPGRSLADKVALARAALAGGDVASASSILHAFEREVAAQSGKKLAPDAAAALAGTATRIVAVLGG